ncbi:LysM peptidoglycan-binding domain-containing protein [Phaeobacter sp. B1627]|uniref:LysM peptidoglycan-binding domain-containing protein n=1 Tax=Phaeobacter sp. B1627 TaxID=2583809 RepID=UPI00111B27C7|nr:LysM peptidoglycan-binding domain-containing protein [Phaeobacter sp. B1627]TNJ40861.1 LysM peptidoglycan-binding domain-containing protein [Phaeobacter sp. B1627]
MTKTSGIGAGSGLAIATAATVVIVGGGFFLAKGGVFGPDAQEMLERRLAVLGLVNMPAPIVTRVPQPVLAPLAPQQQEGGDREGTAEVPADTTVAALAEDAETGAEPQSEETGFILSPPVLGLARFETDGSGLIAGSAQAGVEVSVLLDGAVLDRQVVPEGGEFVSFVTITPSTAPRVVSLVARFDGQQLASEDSFILAPLNVDVAANTSEAAAPVAAPVAQETVPQIAEAADGAGADPAAPETGTVVAETGAVAAPEAPDTPAVSDTLGGSVPDVSLPTVSLADDASLPDTERLPVATDAGDAADSDAGTVAQVAPEEESAADGADTAVADATTPESPVTQQTQEGDGSGTAEGTSDGTAVAVADATAEGAGEERSARAAEDMASDGAADGTSDGTADGASDGASEEIRLPTAEVASGAPTTQAPETGSPDVRLPEIAERVDAPQLQVPATAEPEIAAHDDAVAADATPAPRPEVSVAVLRANKDGVTLIQPGTPVAPDLLDKIALDTISYSETGDVQLAGRAQPEALVRVYLDNTPVADIATDGGGRWSGSLTSVAPGIYTLRLDEIDALGGKVLSRLETPFKREAPEALAPVITGEAAAGGHAPTIQAVTVQKGDTLWAISQDRYGSGFLFVRVFEANKGDIRDPDLIYPGQIFTLPD